MFAFQVCGYSKSGKTTVVKNLISLLHETGNKVASIKDIHYEDFQMDSEGKNTFIHAQSGANPVVARGLHETDFLYNYQMDFLQIVSKISADWLVVEGYNSFPLPKIVCGKNDKEVDEFIDGRTFAIAGVLANDKKEYQGKRVFNPLEKGDMAALLTKVRGMVFPLLPYVNDECCGLCGLTCSQMVEAIIRGEKRYEDCVIRKKTIHLRINGKDLPLVSFVQNILRNTVHGVASELKGYEKGKKIEIVIDAE